jgi:hypothetical protein
LLPSARGSRSTPASAGTGDPDPGTLASFDASIRSAGPAGGNGASASRGPPMAGRMKGPLWRRAMRESAATTMCFSLCRMFAAHPVPGGEGFGFIVLKRGPNPKCSPGTLPAFCGLMNAGGEDFGYFAPKPRPMRAVEPVSRVWRDAGSVLLEDSRVGVWKTSGSTVPQRLSRQLPVRILRSGGRRW